MREPVLLALLTLLTCGCQSPAPVPREIPSPAQVAPAPKASAMLKARPPEPAPLTRYKPIKGATAPTVVFLRALANAIDGQRMIDRHAAEKFRQVPAYDPQAMTQSAPEEPPPSTAIAPLDADNFERGAYEQENYTKRLLDDLTRHPTPPSCKKALERYQTLMQLQAIHHKQLASEVQHATQNPDTLTPETRKATLQQAQLYQAERTRVVQEVNQEIERLRTSAPTVAAQVPPFHVQP